MIKILSVFGTRPEAIKMAPLTLALKDDDSVDSRVCVTAQHREMLDQTLRIFDVKPDYDLDVMSKDQTLHDVSARIISRMRPVLIDYKPDIVLVHGDTLTTFCASTAAFFERIKVGHVEAGLRSNDLMAPWPEEANRRVTSIFTNYHFAPTVSAEQNLLKEGVSKDAIFVTGNTVIDALHWMRDKIDKSPEYQEEFSRNFSFLDPAKRMILITGHRRENFGAGFENICAAIKSLAQSYPDVQWVYPVHLNPNVKGPVEEFLQGLPNVYLIDPQDYAPFVYLMTQCYFVLTDSGGVQEEAPALGKPVLVMRDTTERPEAVEAGTAKLVGMDANEIVTQCKKLLDHDGSYRSMSQAINPYGDGKAIPRIVDILKKS